MQSHSSDNDSRTPIVDYIIRFLLGDCHSEAHACSCCTVERGNQASEAVPCSSMGRPAWRRATCSSKAPSVPQCASWATGDQAYSPTHTRRSGSNRVSCEPVCFRDMTLMPAWWRAWACAAKRKTSKACRPMPRAGWPAAARAARFARLLHRRRRCAQRAWRHRCGC